MTVDDVLIVQVLWTHTPTEETDLKTETPLEEEGMLLAKATLISFIQENKIRGSIKEIRSV